MLSETMTDRPVDLREFARFVICGTLATVGNLTAVWIVRQIAPFTVALVLGIAVVMVCSFILSRLFVFRSGEASTVRGEAQRFATVYFTGVAINMAIALALRHMLHSAGLPQPSADMLAAFCGSGSMVVTCYLGHRFYTYRTASLGELLRPKWRVTCWRQSAASTAWVRATYKDKAFRSISRARKYADSQTYVAVFGPAVRFRARVELIRSSGAGLRVSAPSSGVRGGVGQVRQP